MFSVNLDSAWFSLRGSVLAWKVFSLASNISSFLLETSNFTSFGFDCYFLFEFDEHWLPKCVRALATLLKTDKERSNLTLKSYKFR